MLKGRQRSRIEQREKLGCGTLKKNFSKPSRCPKAKMVILNPTKLRQGDEVS
jgi:hypothetical protein